MTCVAESQRRLLPDSPAPQLLARGVCGPGRRFNFRRARCVDLPSAAAVPVAAPTAAESGNGRRLAHVGPFGGTSGAPSPAIGAGFLGNIFGGGRMANLFGRGSGTGYGGRKLLQAADMDDMDSAGLAAAPMSMSAGGTFSGNKSDSNAALRGNPGTRIGSDNTNGRKALQLGGGMFSGGFNQSGPFLNRFGGGMLGGMGGGYGRKMQAESEHA